MKAFIWEDAHGITECYHDGGGLLVIAKSLEGARKLVAENCPPKASPLKSEPTHVYQLGGEPEEKIIKFPDAGCC